MSQENVELVRAAYKAWEPAWASGGEGDLSELLAFLDEDLVSRSHMGPNQDTWRGEIDGFLRCLPTRRKPLTSSA